MHHQVIVEVFERTIADVDEFASLDPLCVIPPDENQYPHSNRHDKPILDDAEQPNPRVSPATKPTAEPDGGAEYPLEPELEPDREPHMFDNEEAYVGVNNEAMYMPIPPHWYNNNAQATNNSHPQSCVDADGNDGVPPKPRNKKFKRKKWHTKEEEEEEEEEEEDIGYKKLKKATTDPPATVVSSLRRPVYEN